MKNATVKQWTTFGVGQFLEQGMLLNITRAPFTSSPRDNFTECLDEIWHYDDSFSFWWWW